ncbi:MAG: hypothetical protein CL840_06195 [Crocinitomicaceae bacterium]|nr:hypothetical protein [Crocinitomicaceae bacterium]|tara:strand:- start:4677 stop:5489 length:813 start_codon:yes stop_codon:yes gene_type:complete
MADKLMNSELLEGVLKTILAFDILEAGLSLKDIEKHLIEAKANEVEVLEVLDFLCVHKILIKVDDLYMLYSKQDETMSRYKKLKFNPLQRFIFKSLELSGWVEGVFALERPGATPLVIFKFYKEIHRSKKEKICTWVSNLLNIRVFHAGIIPKSDRNALAASLLIRLKPVINGTALETFWNRNSWIFDYCNNSSMDYDVLITNSRVRSDSGKNQSRVSAFKNVGVFNISSYFRHLNSKTEFEREYANRLLYASQWIMPRIRHQIKRNRIV